MGYLIKVNNVKTIEMVGNGAKVDKLSTKSLINDFNGV